MLRIRSEGDAVDRNTLKRIIYFARLDDQPLEQVAAQSSEISLDRGQVLINEGGECRGLYFVIEGSVKISRISPEGREQVLNIMGPNQSFSDVPVFDGGRNPATVTALEPSVIGMVPKDFMVSLVRENGFVAEAMLRVFASRLRIMTTLVADMTHLDVAGRVAKVLITYHTSSGQRELRLGQQDLASMVGTTREVVSRALRSLEERGCLLRKGGAVEILSIEKLQEALEESAR